MSTTTAIAALTIAYEAEVAKISDALSNAKATYVLAQLTDAWAGQSKLNAKEISQYSISGRSFSYKTADEMNGAVKALENELNTYIYGSFHLIDLSIGESFNIGY